MAQALDLRSLGEALPSSSPDHQSGVGYRPVHPPLDIKVMSWNIWGETLRGLRGCRNILVPLVVRQANPDILLLQEPRTKILVENIENEGKEYKSIPARKKEESQVLYDSKVFETISPDDQISGIGISLEEAFEQSFPEEEEHMELRKQPEGMSGVYRDRIAYVGLKRKGQDVSPETTIVFMSFHNFNYSEGPKIQDKAAKGFYHIVKKMRELTGCVVVGGADLNQPITGDGVLPYELTQRREGKKKIDYIILAAPKGRAWEAPVTALDFIEAEKDESNLIHGVVRDLLRPPGDGGEPPTIEDALDHDPLMCDLYIQYNTESSE